MNKIMRARVLAVLKRARAMIVRGWCQGTYACDADGVRVQPNSDMACRWCAAGAVRATAGGDACLAEATMSLLAICLPRGRASVTGFNDSQDTKRPVLALFDRAIKRLEADQ